MILKSLIHGSLPLILLSVSPLYAREPQSDLLIDRIRPFFQMLSGSETQFVLDGRFEVPIDGKPQTITLHLARFDEQSFDLDLVHADYEVRLRRRTTETSFTLPKHKVVFRGRGEVAEQDCLRPQGLTDRLFSQDSMLSAYAPLIQQGKAETAALLLKSLAGLTFDAESGVGSVGDVGFRFSKPGVLNIEVGDATGTLSVSTDPGEAPAAVVSSNFKVVNLPRIELERTLVRGVRRASSILAPSPLLTTPLQTPRKISNGELRWIGNQRVVLLQGTPEEVGRAHGELLKSEAQHCIDSVLYTFGMAQTIRTGRWFRHDLKQAYERLAPHIPERHKVETRAMAAAMGLEPRLAETLNVFPELFHCSGFAVFGNATSDGKLYHGRVLDYMTTIGLQDSATTFIVKLDGRIPFVNVGYAGFIGSVSGMNAESISLGEMGGRGEGKWDGVPMATLMRRALEECSTLDEVLELWKTSPRTCEYYYVFADGKTRQAVGVAALPESVEFIIPGQAHPRLGEGIEDAVVLSAGSRLQTLRERVQERFGEIDADVGKWLMSRPVAMKSNLHNVLFVPEDGVLYVANADHKHPAAERPYVKLNLRDLLNSMSSPQSDVVRSGSGD